MSSTDWPASSRQRAASTSELVVGSKVERGSGKAALLTVFYGPSSAGVLHLLEASYGESYLLDYNLDYKPKKRNQS